MTAIHGSQPKAYPKINYGQLSSIVSLLFLLFLIEAMKSRILGMTMLCILEDVATATPANFNYTGRNQTHEQLTNYTGNGQPAKSWSAIHQSHVISVSSWSRLLVLPLSAFILRRFTAQSTIIWATFATSIATLLFPSLAKNAGWQGALLDRAGLGAFMAFVNPATDTLCSQLIPNAVKSSAYALVTTGQQFALILATPLTSLFCTDPNLGWSGVYYFTGIFGLIWCLAWILYLCRSDLKLRPAEAKKSTNLTLRMTENTSERALIASEPENEVIPKNSVFRKILTQTQPLVDNVLSDSAIWPLFICDLAASWTIYLYVFYIPQFYQNILNLPLAANGYYSALPFAVQIVGKIGISTLSDCIKRRKKSGFSANFISKICNTIGFLGSGLCIMSSLLIPGLSKAGAVTLLCLGYGFYAFTAPGFRTSYISINPDWSGVIAVACQICSGLGGVTLPYIVGGVLGSNIDLSIYAKWTLLFGVVLTADLLAAGSYAIWGSVATRNERALAAKERRQRL